MRASCIALSAILFFWVGNSADGQITKLTNDSFVNGVVPNTVTNDLKIDFTGQYTGSQLVIELTAGSIYRDGFGSANGSPPNPAFFGVAPSLEFDSFIAQGNVGSGGPFGEPLPGGGAVNLGGAPAAQFDSAAINQQWNASGGQVILDQSDFLTARITLSDDAQGTWSYMASADGLFGQVENYSISNGYLLAPLCGDFDNSGQVGQGDLDLVLLDWGSTTFSGDPSSLSGGQFDGLVSQNELNKVLLNWGNTTQTSWEIEPELINPADSAGVVSGFWGDYNGSGQVEQADLDIVLLNWGTSNYPGDETAIPGGGPFDGLVGGNELDGVFLNWGDVAPLAQSSQAVPEPTSFLMLGIACLARFRRRR